MEEADEADAAHPAIIGAYGDDEHGRNACKSLAVFAGKTRSPRLK
jgi:hypothetical protein